MRLRLVPGQGVFHDLVMQPLPFRVQRPVRPGVLLQGALGLDGCFQGRVIERDADRDERVTGVEERRLAAPDLEFEAVCVRAGAGLDDLDLQPVHDPAAWPAFGLEDVAGVDQAGRQPRGGGGPGFCAVEGFPPGAVPVAEPAVGVGAGRAGQCGVHGLVPSVVPADDLQAPWPVVASGRGRDDAGGGGGQCLVAVVALPADRQRRAVGVQQPFRAQVPCPAGVPGQRLGSLRRLGRGDGGVCCSPGGAAASGCAMPAVAGRW